MMTLLKMTAISAFALGFAACGGVSNTSSTNVQMAASSYTVPPSAGAVTMSVARTGDSTTAVSVAYATVDGTAVAGTNYTATSGTLQWAENDATTKTVSVPVSNVRRFEGTKSFQLTLTDPSASTNIGNPGSAEVSIAGEGMPVPETLELADATYDIVQGAGSLTVTVNRDGDTSGAVSVGYTTADGTAVAGTDYTTTTGILSWEDGDAAAKTFTVDVSGATPFVGEKTFTIDLSNASGAAIGAQSSAAVTISGSASPVVGNLKLSASSYSVRQNAGSLSVTVNRILGSSGAISVAYATTNGTALAGSQYTATQGTLNWADGDAVAKTFSIPISNATPFTGNKSFTIALSNPSTGAAISSPGSATVAITGDAAAPVGNVELSASTYSVGQGAGSLTVTVNRSGGSSGAVSVAYATTNGTAVAGTAFTAASGTLKWATGDAAAKTFSIPISNATPFSGTKSFTVTLSGATGGATVNSPSSAIVSITGDAVTPAVGSLQLSASSYAVAQSAGSLTVTVNRTGGSSGAVSVSYAVAAGTAVAGTNYTATSGALQWASGNAASKTFSIPISNATPFTGNKNFTVRLSSPAGGATLGSPNSATVTIAGSSLPPVATGTLWVYYNGVFNWGGDWSFAATQNYKDTSGDPIEGPYDIEVTSQKWGGWQPYHNANCQSNLSLCFPTTPYQYIIFSAKPTVTGQVFGVGFMSSGDTPDGPVLADSSPYCSGGSNPAVGQWESCKIPLSVFHLTDTTILKFWITDQTGLSSNHWYLDNVGFTPN